MATNIPPHNLGEVIDGVIALINNPEISIKELMKIIKGPDFPTGGIIVGKSGIKKSIMKLDGGQLELKLFLVLKKMQNGKMRILITELPYQVNKARLIANIADLVKEKKE